MKLNEYKTMAGITADQIRPLLAEPFRDPKAYKRVDGTGADLTDINTGHMISRVNDIFGPKGIGWNLVFDRDDLELIGDGGKRILARLKFAEFVYFLTNGGDERLEIRIPTSGANQNTPQYAEEGAKTVALGTALKGLGFQEDVYMGHLNHRNAGSYKRRVEKKATSLPPETGANIKPEGSNKDQKTEAAKEVEAKSGNGDIGSYVVPFGANKGKALSELSGEDLEWAAGEMSPFNDAGQEYQAKAQEYLTLVAA